MSPFPEAELAAEGTTMAREVITFLARRVSRTLAKDEVEELVHEALFDAVRSFDPARGATFKTWFERRAVWRVLSAARRAARRTRLLRDLEYLHRHEHTPSRECSVEQHLNSTLPVLDARERELVERHFFGGDRFDAIAGDLGFSKSWASRIYTRALARLRKALA